ncbi:pyridoxine 5'-phosphate synthase [Terrihabitans rhizophilus]|uniref:Pyridoxine 5'-phosphate synthase n=1 Tax=Terrihabitans rhizophilus TaxID=3092662 RepID=A0ABU4RR49_9HYPH|nr:pyridoxine 5'-phosphate synthase [Terrihabitans sp. PJ23]MDX6806653.1 pyridoxine 5'-phosphate synthase [Terrihabitans sp. PJ23]
MPSDLRLGINVDHVATVRNARGGVLPDPVRAARAALEAGADGITAHLREDRRHIRDADIAALRELPVPLNFEMAATEEMVAMAVGLRPHACCLVPEKREERTTEGGLDVLGQRDVLADSIARLSDAGIRVSLFVEASPDVLAAAAELGAPVVELHTGSWCDALAAGDAERALTEFKRIVAAASLGEELGLELHAGHGLDYATARAISAVPQIRELNIGHFLIGEAIFVGLGNAIARMRTAMEQGRAGREVTA